MSKHRDLPLFLSGDGDEKVKVRNAGDFATRIEPRLRDECSTESNRRHKKFLKILVEYFGSDPFRRYDLDAGRIGWLLGREIKYAGLGKPNPASAGQWMVLDYAEISRNFPDVDLSGSHDS